MNTPEMREECAQKLEAAASHAARLSAFVGLDGFVDEILHVVDKRESATAYQRMAKIQQFASRLAGASGKSTNIELVNQVTKLGGNGPIMANALASFGLRVSYLGTLGYPNLHPVFQEFSKRAEVVSIAEPGHTDALEFEDGKIMVGKHESLKEMSWQNIGERFDHAQFATRFGSSDLVAFVNWTMLTEMSAIWSALLSEVCPKLDSKAPRHKLFFDLADPEKRTNADILAALKLIRDFEKHFDVILGLNEKESHEIAEVLGLERPDGSPDALAGLGARIGGFFSTTTVVIHPVAYALAVTESRPEMVEGPFVSNPLITTGAGDHFNSGFCLGKLLQFSDSLSLLTGVATSGFYVRTAMSPTINDLVKFLRAWPEG